MPAGLPNETTAINRTGNPAAGNAIIMDALSGPKGSPFDRDTVATVSANASTGAMCTGIGFGLTTGPIGLVPGLTTAQSIQRAGFIDDSGEITGGNSTIIYIGGGKCTATVNGIPPVVPYTAGFAPCGAGNGASRDGGAGPAFTGFPHKMVTAVGTVANGVLIETGFINRTGFDVTINQSTFGSSTTQNAAPS